MDDCDTDTIGTVTEHSDYVPGGMRHTAALYSADVVVTTHNSHTPRVCNTRSKIVTLLALTCTCWQLLSALADTRFARETPVLRNF